MMNKLHEFLDRLGFSSEENMLYSILAKRESLSILHLSRISGINRTKVYRIIEKMHQKGLVEEIIDEHKKLVRIAGTDKLELMVKEEEARLIKLRESFPVISKILSENPSLYQPGTKVLFYRGKEGVRSQVWNTLKTKGELLGYSYRPLSELIGKYYEKWYQEWEKRGLRMRDIYSDSYLEGEKTVKQKLDSLEIKSKYIISRYISSKILNITHQMDIYNDIVSVYHWHEGEIFGVEIYNEKIALMQKQMFEIVWKMTA